MFPILYDTNIMYGTVPSDNGLGVLSDALACKITEERNGIYELEMTYPASGLHANDIQLRRLLKAKPNFTDDPQLFRIYKVGKVLGSSFKINARHISYDLSGVEIINGSAGSAVAACELLSTDDFHIDTDKNVVANFRITEPSSRRSWLGGKTGSLLDVYGTGEYHYDNFNIHFLLHRGTDRGVQVRYGKNLLSLSQDRDSSNLTTAVIVFWKDSENGEIIYSAKTSTGLTLDVEATQCIDVSQDYETKPTVEQLNLRAQSIVQSQSYSVVKHNVKLNFLQIGTLKDRVDLCDEVKIIYEDFDIEAVAKCVKTTWNVLDEKYESIELGDLKSNFADTFISNNAETRALINANKTILQIAIENATSLITGNEGGYVVIHDSNDDGYPDELLIMDTDDINSATKVWRWNNSGLGYSSTGYAGNYGLAMTVDGQIVANFVTTGTMTANRVRAGLLADTSGKNWFDLDSGRAHFENLEVTIGGVTKNVATELSDKVDSDSVRTAFAADSSSITIQSGVITFKANSFVVDSTKLKIDASGTVRSSSFQSNASIDFYNSGWTTKYLTIGSRTISSTVIPQMLMYDSSGGSAVVIESNVKATSGGQSIGTIQLFGKQGLNNETSNYSYIGSGILQLSVVSNRAAVSIGGGSLIIPPGGGSVYIQNSGHIYVSNGSSDVITMEGNTGAIRCVSLTQTSTRKVKKNIEPLTDSHDILKLQPVLYDFIDELQGTHKAGLIAEDAVEVLPSIVSVENGEPVAIDYIQLIPRMLCLLQEHERRLNHE